MSNGEEELTFGDYIAERRRLCADILDRLAEFESKFPGAEVNAIRIDRSDITSASDPTPQSKISRVEVSIIL